ncbi:MAG TPA: lamin tail domain-containing protein, partial [Candidatus Binatia bacterium]|nr:lamin tail domain-containing protein [Candidatus Binatia bacterium]
TVVGNAGGFDITAGGTNIFGNADQFTFYYQEITGDFDVNVRLGGLGLSDAWAKAGLMARETTAPGSRYAGTFATPNIAGALFQARLAAGTNPVVSGQFPVNYPNTWLRLRKDGTSVMGFASIDGQNWSQLGLASLTNAAQPLLVGLAVTAANGSQTATAQFRDYGDVVGGTFGAVKLDVEPPGPSSRKTGLVISEIMYHPKFSNDLEFVEILNANNVPENIGGYRLAGDIAYTFPSNTTLAAGGVLVVARRPALLQAAYGISGVLGPWLGEDGSAVTNALPDDEGRVRLRNSRGAVLLEVNYKGGAPWPLAADGSGHSLVLARPSYGENDARAWVASARIGGSPGVLDPIPTDNISTVVINEFLANSPDPIEDFIELYNAGNSDVDLSGAWLSDDRDTNKFRIPDGTSLPARGFVSFTQSTLGFALSSGGERIYLVNSNQTRVIDCYAFEAQALGVSSGRLPDGSPGFHELVTRTPGAANSALLIRDIVINEIMFNPISDDSKDEYVELYNRGASAVDVSNWRFTAGITYTMPAGTIIPANGYLVVANNVPQLRSKYPQLNTTNTVGNYNGSLDNGGERLALAIPEYFFTTNGNTVVTNANYIVVDEVNYVDSGRWSRWADGGGSSLELIDPHSDNRLMANWADSDETAKSEWVSINYRDTTDNIYPRSGAGQNLDEVQIMILGAGEALIDDVEVHAESPTTGPNLVGNGTFTSGIAGWTIQGNHVASSLEASNASNPSACLHLRASAGGDNGANRVETDLTSALTMNTPASVRARARWLKGHRDVLFRTHGGGLEGVITLPVPDNLGTPGLPNSRRLANAGPSITDVSHSPALPVANQPVVVTARVSDVDGIAAVLLQYRQDPNSTLTTVGMRDDGTGGDALANDGIYSATIGGFGSGTLIAFRVQATDAAPAAATTLFPPDAPTRECLI